MRQFDVNKYKETLHNFITWLFQFQHYKISFYFMRNEEYREESSFDELSEVLRLVRTRQQKYLRLLAFLKKNANSHSQQPNQLTIFTTFITISDSSYLFIDQQQKLLIEKFKQQKSSTTQAVNKGVFRLCGRIMEMVDYSHNVSKDSIVYCTTLQEQHRKFKKQMNNIITAEKIQAIQFLEKLFNYLKHRYYQEITKVKYYITSIEKGQQITLKSIFQRKYKINKYSEDKKCAKSKNKANNSISIDNSSNRNIIDKHKSIDQVQKIMSILAIPTIPTLQSQIQAQTTQKKIPTQKQLKQKVVYKQLKNYNILKLNKQQYLDDFILHNSKVDEHGKKIYNTLMQKNKINKQQIKVFYRRVESVPNMDKHMEKQREQIRKAKIEMEMQSKWETKSGSTNIKNDSSKINTNILRNRPHKNYLKIKENKHSNKIRQTVSVRNNSQNKIKLDGNFGENIISTINSQTQYRELNKVTLKDSPKSKRIYFVKSPIIFQDQSLLKPPQIPTTRKYEPIKAKRQSQDYANKFLNRKQLLLTQRPTTISFYQ